MDLEQIGKTCHAVHLAYCNQMGIDTQHSWEELSTEHKNTVIDSIRKIISGEINSVVESHNNFVKMKTAAGWVYGSTYSKESKTNARLLPFEMLVIDDRIKEVLFFECVKSFM